MIGLNGVAIDSVLFLCYNMYMRRLFIIRKDLHLTPGKLAAQVGHCCEAYWTNLLKDGCIEDNEFVELPCIDLGNPFDKKSGNLQIQWYRQQELSELSEKAFKEGKTSFTTLAENPRRTVSITLEIPKDIWEGYVNGIFTKTICEARNKNHLLKAETMAKELCLVGGVDYGFINDNCLTELSPENEDGTTTVGMWFGPLPDETAHAISRKFPLYRG